jgi:competence protein ComEA
MKKLRIRSISPTEQKILFSILLIVALGTILSLFNYTPKQRLQLQATTRYQVALDSLLPIDFIPRFDILTVSFDELLYINGVGPSLAAAIIEYRDNNEITKLDDLLNIRGVGTARLETLKEYLYIEQDIIMFHDEDKAPQALPITTFSVCDRNCRQVHINTASHSQLMTLRGIGQVRADDIINYRNNISKFRSIEEIKNVRGIGETTFQNIKELICIGD